MGKEFAIELSQDIPLGILKFKPSNEELAILRLISCEKEEAIKHWEELWKHTEDYEDLLFSCKELMPSVVNKIQTCCLDGEWQQFIPKNAQFLAGLPRYTWTKNQYIINEYQKIAAALDQENIEFIALKGVCEMLDGSTLAFMRTSRDIDLLIQEEDWEKCRQIFENIGWAKSKNLSNWSYLNSPIKPHAETFQKTERIFDLDVHFAAIPGAKSASQRFTKNLWKRKVRAKKYPSCFIPSVEDRYIITVANAFNIHNWIKGHTTKYIFDMLSLSSQIDANQLKLITTDAERLVKMGDSIRQSANVVHEINGVSIQQLNKQYRINLPVSQNFLIHIIRLLIIFQLINLLKNLNNGLHVLIYFFSRVILKVSNTIKWFLFSNKSDSSQINRPITYHPNQFSIHFFRQK